MTGRSVRAARQMRAGMAPARRPGSFLLVPAGERADLAAARRLAPRLHDPAAGRVADDMRRRFAARRPG